jgi:hypothetical protein
LHRHGVAYNAKRAQATREACDKKWLLTWENFQKVIWKGAHTIRKEFTTRVTAKGKKVYWHERTTCGISIPRCAITRYVCPAVFKNSKAKGLISLRKRIQIWNGCSKPVSKSLKKDYLQRKQGRFTRNEALVLATEAQRNQRRAAQAATPRRPLGVGTGHKELEKPDTQDRLVVVISFHGILILGKTTIEAYSMLFMTAERI